jgi:hypothetical protein
MRVPDEFNRMCVGFHQGTFRMTLDEMIKHALGFLDENQARVVKQFLDKLLSGRYTAAEMKGVLRRSPAQVSFGNAKSCHAFLKRMRELME